MNIEESKKNIISLVSDYLSSLNNKSNIIIFEKYVIFVAMAVPVSLIPKFLINNSQHGMCIIVVKI